jgi:hypothetical protein
MAGRKKRQKLYYCAETDCKRGSWIKNIVGERKLSFIKGQPSLVVLF